MNLKWSICLLILASWSLVFSQENGSEDISINSFIDGTLVKPSSARNLVIIIGDSGPTDRDGNQGYNRSNYIKKLAEILSANNIASFRFDKRIIKQLKLGIVDNQISFTDFVKDAQDVINYFDQSKMFDSIFLIGHGQGSLIGMLASAEKVDGFISLCGSGKNIGDTLIEQVELSAPDLKEDTERVIKKLKQGKTTRDYPKQLASAFNLDTQPFLISWMKFEPQEEINKLRIPVLVVHGGKDIQVADNEGELLISNCNQCQLKYIENMNHVLVDIVDDELENYKSYSDPNYNLSSELTEILIEFIVSE